MGLLLKEALKCLCGVNRWSYAVFWKIGCRNPTLLVWEECYYEPARLSAFPGISGNEGTELLSKEWEGLGSASEGQPSRPQVDDRVCSLVNKMIINGQVHVVGEGIVGRAAFTGAHLWILPGNCLGVAHPSEVMAEVHHQFLSGMQTIAVIPVLPHGVVQLGSTLTIMEDMEFVDSVKSLFLQLGGVPGALLSDSYMKLDPGKNIGAITSLETHVLSEPARGSSSKMEKFAPLNGDNCNQQIAISRASKIVSHPSHSLSTQAQDNMQANALPSQIPLTMISPVAKSFNVLVQSNIFPSSNADLILRSQLETRALGSQVILSSSDGTLNQQASAYYTRSGPHHKPTGGQSGVTDNGLTFLEQQILSNSGLLEPVNNRSSVSSNISSQIRINGDLPPDSLKDSVVTSLLGGRELPNAGCGLQTLTSVPCRNVDSNSSCTPQEGIGFQFGNSSNTGVVLSSNQANLLNSGEVLPGGSHQGHSTVAVDKRSKAELPARLQGVENDLFQALDLPAVHPEENLSRSGSTPGFLQECLVSGQKHDKKIPTSQGTVFEDVCVQPASGEDLFDILGLDFKSKLACGSWNDCLINGSDASLWSFGTDSSVCITELDAGSNFYSVNDGVSQGGIFSETRSDHLLDAVVSKVHSSANQNSDDNVSCRTTLTKISNSSIPTDSSCSRVGLPDKTKVEMFGLPPTASKSEMVGSSSFKSGCSKDNAEESQVNSMYRSPISLWVEDSRNLKHDNSISTAHSKKPDELVKPNRKRLRPGENPRPRPKDRQMIQDRVKELREIVPNGTKCSIDALLERTIKHMLFLQSVTKHADKLKQTGESKIINKEGGLLLKDNFEGGATWAFEVGSQSMICPIIVEDLNPPRQMLVEMLCEERGLFLEIADIIRGLGLTILKGVMEARNDKVWARFAVEADRDVTRMEIFLSLVSLLEQTVKSGSTAVKGIDNGNIMTCCERVWFLSAMTSMSLRWF
uniref:BHLH domain-containing protein n=1 Tax=Nelumbo nucifera TaxID=4432 RepID=A0A822ZZX8_NELNU|nr:TPA_asm: hypothetical protein HUJ06_018303 [Nelumbo nucifera]